MDKAAKGRRARRPVPKDKVLAKTRVAADGKAGKRPVPKKKKNSRLEQDTKQRQRDLLDKKTKKYGAINIMLEEEIEEFAEGPEI
jgi:hypothetical protein